jgi:glycosyltransferase involved in cell wall biosynthesis
MKKICIDARMIASFGIGTYIQDLIKSLENEKLNIFLIINRKDENKFSFLKKINLIFFNAKIYSLKEIFFFSFFIPKCDLFFSPHFNIPIFPIKAKKRICTIHDTFHLSFYKNLSFLEKIYAKFFYKSACKLSNKIITVSNFSKNEIIKYLNPKKNLIEVIHNSIEKKINLEEKFILETKKKYNFPEKYFLFVGSLKKHKNLKNVILAFEKFSKKNKNIFLIIIGSFKNLNNSIDIKEILENKKNINEKLIFIKNYITKQELNIFYQNAISLIFPSFYEGFGYPPLEAMQNGCPTIVSNIAPIKEVCSEDSLYVDPSNVDDILFAMDKIYENKDLRNLLIEKGKKRVDNFTFDKFKKMHLNLINKVIENRQENPVCSHRG